MATAVMAAPSVSKKSRSASQDPTPQEIIASARSAPAGAGGAVRVSLLTAVLLWACFTPLALAPLGWVALVPLLLLVRLERPTRWMYSATYFGGLMFWMASLQWMRLGDPTMYIAWSALSFYLALYFPVFIGLTRVAVWKLKLPLILAAPAIWTGLEYFRAFAMTGFSWYQLGHSQVGWLEIIQISDIVGAYGVSFLLAMSSAAFVELVPVSQLAWLKLLPIATTVPTTVEPGASRRRWKVAGIMLATFALTLTYGFARRAQAKFTAGPRVAAVQANFVAAVNNPNTPDSVYIRHRSLTAKAIQQQADMIVWPEVMFQFPYFVRPEGFTDAQLHDALPQVKPEHWGKDSEVSKMLLSLSQGAAAAMVIGVETVTANEKGLRLYNSALFVDPGKGIKGRYDKQHRVPFGEYVPLADTVPFLGSLIPYRGNFGIQAGRRGVAFDYKGLRFAPVICFEDTVPHVVRHSVQNAIADDPAHHKVDVLLNLSNDGWFHGSSELDQHLATAVFRAVEMRTPMVRAVNTGISAIIDGDGAIRAKAVDPKTHKSKEIEAVVCDFVPLDNRHSPYLAGGDWFACLCLILCAACMATGSFTRFSKRRANAVPQAS